jgi:two-component system nitrogen regulation sensor histidine kinase GlnL
MKTLLPDLSKLPSSALLEHLNVAILWLDENLHVAYLNPAAEALLGTSLRQAHSEPVRAFFPAETVLLQHMAQSLDSDHPCTLREITLPAAGRDMVVDCVLSPLQDSALGHGLLVEIMDIDRHVHIAREEHLLAQQQATRSLLRGLAHEIKNPLGGLRGAAQLLHGELPTPEQREYTEVILHEADRLRNLVDRMIGAQGVPKKRMLNVHETLEHVRRLVTLEMQGSSMQLLTSYDPSIPELYAEPDLLVQAVLNIVRNAMQVMGTQPDAQIILRTRVMRQFTIGSTRHRLVARIDIEDNGPGIPADLQDTLFLPMVSGRVGGVGLGLSISQSLVAQHGGLIEFSSQPGQTIFSLLLPFMTRAKEVAR